MQVINSEYELQYKNISVECGNAMQINGGNDSVNEDSSKLKIQVLNVLKQRRSKWIIFLISFNSVVVYYLWCWSIATNSLALKAYINKVVFNVCALVVCLISIWVEQNTLPEGREFAYSGEPSRRPGKFVSELPPRCKSNGKLSAPQYRQVKCQRLPAPAAATDAVVVDLKGSVQSKYCHESIWTLGLEKYEVIALLIFSCFTLISGLLIGIDAIARIKQQSTVHEGRLILGAILGLVAHLVTIVTHPDAGLSHVVCKALPCPTLKGANPILGDNLISFVILCGVHAAIHFWELYTVDTAAAFAVIGLTIASMLPLAFYTASIIIQKLSHHMSEQLNKCLHEALIIDGVLEFRNERFWTKSFGKLAGSLEVRIRKNADEHYVLRNVVKRLSQVVSTLDVQEFREPTNNYSISRLPLEYYVDELLAWRADGAVKVKSREKIAEVPERGKSVKIEEVLNCGNGSLEELRSESRAGYATLLRNCEDCKRVDGAHLFRDNARNVLLMGSRWDMDDLGCPMKLYCRA